MADTNRVTDILNDYVNNTLVVNNPNTVPPQKQVVDPAEYSQDALYGPAAGIISGNGQDSGNYMQNLISKGSFNQLNNAFGYDKAIEIIGNRGAALNTAMTDSNTRSGALTQAGDVGVSAVLGAANVVTGAGVLAASAVNPNLGLDAARLNNSFNEWGNSYKSDELTAQQKFTNASIAMAERDNAATEIRDIIEGKDPTVAGLKRFGSDVLSSVGETLKSGQGTTDVVANAAGSLGGIGKVTGVVTKVGTNILLKDVAKEITASTLGDAAKKQALANATKRAADYMERTIAPRVAVGTAGLMGGGDAVGNFVDNVDANNTPEFMTQNSPEYRELINRGYTHQDAVDTLAAGEIRGVGLSGALLSAAANAPLGKFLAKPTKITGNPGTGVANVLGETVTESIEGGGAKLIGNVGFGNYVDNQDTLAGVGTAAGQEAIGGFGSAAGMQTPNLIVGSAKATGNVAMGLGGAAINTASSLLSEKTKAREQANIDSAPQKPAEALKTVTSMADAANAPPSAPVPTTDPSTGEETTPEADKVVTSSTDGTAFDVKNLNTVTEAMLADPILKKVVGENRVLGSAIADVEARLKASTDSNDMADLASTYRKLAQPFQDIVDLGSQYVESLPDQDQLAARNLLALSKEILQSNELAKVDEQLKAFYATPEGQKELSERQVTQKTADVVAHAAINNPQAILDNPNNNVSEVLKMQKSGKVVIPAKELSAIEALSMIMETVKEQQGQSTVDINGPKDAALVNSQIQYGDDESRNNSKEKSSYQHLKGIIAARASGNKALTNRLMQHYTNFVVGQNNKVSGINAHYTAGDKAPRSLVQVATPDGKKMVDSKTTYGITRTNAKSVRFAQGVGKEARFITKMFNRLVEAYPDLGDAVVATDLDPSIVSLDSANLGGKGKDKANIPPAAPVVIHKPGELRSDNYYDGFVEGTKYRTVKNANNSVIGVRTYQKDGSKVDAFINNDGELVESKDNIWKYKTPEEYKKAKALLDKLGGLDPKSTEHTETSKAIKDLIESTKDKTPVHVPGEQVGEKGFKKSFYPGKYFRIIESDSGNGVVGVQKQNGNAKPITHVVLKNGTLGEVGVVDETSYWLPKTPEETAKAKNILEDINLLASNDPKIKDLFASLKSVTGVVAITPTTSIVLPPNPTIEDEADAVIDPKSMTDSFPNLIGSTDGSGVTNFFTTMFTAVGGKLSRAFGLNNPLSLFNKTRLEKILDKTNKARITPEVEAAYKNLPALVEKIVEQLNKKLASHANTSPGKNVKTKTFMEMIQDPEANGQPADYSRTRMLNITRTVTVDGKPSSLVYDDGLIRTAVLAVLQKAVISKLGSSGDWSITDIANFLNVEEDLITIDVLNQFNEGAIATQLIEGLVGDIKNYWGVRGKKDSTVTHNDGIPSGVASEILAAMEVLGLVDIKTTYLETEEEIKAKGTKTPAYRTVKVNADTVVKFLGDGVKKFPSFIEEVILEDKTRQIWLKDEVPPVSKSMKNRPYVPLTKQQKAMQEHEQKTVYTVNKPLHDLYKHIGLDNYLSVFGHGKIDQNNLNKEDAISKSGVNQGISGAYNTMMNDVAEMQSIADADGTKVEDMTRRYKYSFLSNSRLQMDSPFNPQTSKTSREIFLPTWATISFSDQRLQDNYVTAVSQMMGIKVHNQASIEDTRNSLMKIINDPTVQDFLAMVRSGEALNSSPETVAAIIKAALPMVGDTQAGIHALFDYANATTEDGQFKDTPHKTAVYLEADGVSNGVINALRKMVTGKFTPEWIKNMERGGLFFSVDQTLNVYRNGGGDNNVDVYGAVGLVASNIAKSELAKVNNLPTKDRENALRTTKAVKYLLDRYDMDMSIDDVGNVTMTRGATKHPITTFNYGSGKASAAKNILDSLLSLVYQDMSLAVQRQNQQGSLSNAEAMFMDSPIDGMTAEDQMYDFVEAINALTQGNFYYYNGELKYKQDKLGMFGFGKKNDFKNFRLSGKHYDNAASNINFLTLSPIKDAMDEVLGYDLAQAMELIQTTTQLQGIALAEEFMQVVNQENLALNKGVGDRARYVVSQAQQQKIMEDLLVKYPLIKSEYQSFIIAKSRKTEVPAQTISETLDNKLRIPASVRAPQDPGVAGSATLIIGTGDGLMMQFVSTLRNLERTLKIFDGMHVPVDLVQDGGLAANEGVAYSWANDNLYRSLATALEVSEEFITNGLIYGTTDAEKTLKSTKYGQLHKNIEELGLSLGDTGNLSSRLHEMADQMDARNAALLRVNHSVDQMAATRTPFVFRDGVDISSMTTEEKATQLNEYYEEELIKVKASRAGYVKGYADLGKLDSPNAYGRGKTKTGNSGILTEADVAKIIKIMPTPLQNLMNAIPLADVLKRVKIQYANKKDANDEEGSFDPATNIITLKSTSQETLVHEVLHAATHELLMSYYSGTMKNARSIAAIKRLEALMGKFKKLTVTQVDGSLEVAFNDAIAAMADVANREGARYSWKKASEMGEFISWTLSNSDLITVTKNTPIVNTKGESLLVRLTAKAKEMALKLFGANGIAESDIKTLYAQIALNTAMLTNGPKPAKAVKTVAEVSGETALKHNSAYGDNSKLVDLSRRLAKLVKNSLDPNINPAIKKEMIGKVFNTLVPTQDVFPMTHQEQDVFSRITILMNSVGKVNPVAIVKYQELLSHFIATADAKELANLSKLPEAKVSAMIDFFAKKNTQNTNTRDLITQFIGLATTNEQFRMVLNHVAMPKDIKTDKTFDGYLTYMTNTVMKKLDDRMTNVKPTDKDMLSVIDSVNTMMANKDADKNSTLAIVSNTIGSLLEQANDGLVKVVKGSGSLVTKGGTKLTEVDNKYANQVGKILEVMGKLADKDATAELSTSAESLLNKMDGKEPIRELLSDIFFNRTESNGSIYDMIKSVRRVVQDGRDMYRTGIPKQITAGFKTTIAKVEMESLTNSIIQVDTSVFGKGNFKTALELMTDTAKLNIAIKSVEDEITDQNEAKASEIFDKSKQLANFMMTGKPGTNLARNATAIALGLNPGHKANVKANVLVMEQLVDKLVSMYAMKQLAIEDVGVLKELVKRDEMAGLENIHNINTKLVEQNKKRLRRQEGFLNYYKGHVPYVADNGVTLIVADDKNHFQLIERGFERIGDYVGSPKEGGTSKGYYYAAVPTRASLSQGIMQYATVSGSGITRSGYTTGLTAGLIGMSEVDSAIQSRSVEKATDDHLMPIYNSDGEVVDFERSIDPEMLKKVGVNREAHKLLGVNRGRMHEEDVAMEYNKTLIKRLQTMYDNDVRNKREDEYINIFDSKDPVLKDMVKLMSTEILEYVEEVSGNKNVLMVRRDMVKDVFGYRAASVSDLWTGNSRYDKSTRAAIKDIVVSLAGNDGYTMLVNSERNLQSAVSFAKNNIVIRSGVVFVANAISTVKQLIIQGMNPVDVAKAYPKKLREVRYYVDNREKEIKLLVSLQGESDPVVIAKLKHQLQVITDSNERLTIWPLIEAGELSAISDADVNEDTRGLVQGKAIKAFKDVFDKMPVGVQTLAKNAVIAEDTAIYKFLQQGVQYGDFLGKATYMDHLMQKKGMTQKEALAVITDEFIHYDRLPGRFRGAFESMGLGWFLTFKLKAISVGYTMVRDQPLRALLMSLLPMPGILGSAGTPVEGNMLSKLADGSAGYAFGPEQGLNTMDLNPFVNFVD